MPEVKVFPASRLTEQAKTVMAWANETWVVLGLTQFGPMVLLYGLVCERESIAATALQRCGVDLNALQATVEAEIAADSLGEGPVPPVTPKAEAVIDAALRDATAEGGERGWIRSDHFLVALVQVDCGPAAEILRGVGVTAATVRREAQLLLVDGVGENATSWRIPDVTLRRRDDGGAGAGVPAPRVHPPSDGARAEATAPHA